jgi:hypothetical protein
LPFNSDLARKKFFASKVDRQPYYDKHFHPKGTKSKYDNTVDISGRRIADAGEIIVPNPTSVYPHKINAYNQKNFDRIMDNLHDPHSSAGHGSGRESNKKLIITGKNQFFKPTIINQKEFREMVSRRAVDNMVLRLHMEDKGIDISKEKMPEKFPMTDAGFAQFRRAMKVGVVPLNQKK